MADSAWRLVPVMVLRQAGFPIDLMELLCEPAIIDDIAQLREAESAARDAADALKTLLRTRNVMSGVHNAARAGSLGSSYGRLRPITDDLIPSLCELLPKDSRTVVSTYQKKTYALWQLWADFQSEHSRRIQRGRTEVARLFRGNPFLREVLLLSNDSTFTEHDRWLTKQDAAVDGDRGRKMTDLLAMYLQRVATKNETHSHFGPFTVGTVSPSQGIEWSGGTHLERHVYFSHWAAELLAGEFARHPGLRDGVFPRRRPLVFVQKSAEDTGSVISEYTLTSDNGLVDDWMFAQKSIDRSISAAEAWLLRQCDGSQSITELRQEWLTTQYSAGLGSDGDLDMVLGHLVDRGWLVCRYEIPVGDTTPLVSLRRQISGTPSAVSWASEIIDGIESKITAFATGTVIERQNALTEAKIIFEHVTLTSANRGRGKHYADRSIVFEECHRSLNHVTTGGGLVELISTELAASYDLALLGPRIRILREKSIVAQWLSHRFGESVAIPLPQVYAQYFTDREELRRACDHVDAELNAMDQRIIDELMTGAPSNAHEVNVTPERLTSVLERFQEWVPAVCNPDILIAAADATALDRGELLAIPGEVHAFRELLTHSCFAPDVYDKYPAVVQDVVDGYQSLMDSDELLCDIVRTHSNNTSSQVLFPGPDLEIFGRSPKRRAQVIQPTDLYLVVNGNDVSLHAANLPQRLRLLAPPSGDISVRSDPLCVFSFPRKLSGGCLDARGRSHMPRIVSGRIVLHRESWQLAADELSGLAPGSNGGSGDAAEFYAISVLRERLQIPRWVFAKAEGEPKPVYVDFYSPLLVRQFFRMLRRHRSWIGLSEMLPDPSQLWLEIDGSRHTSEIRCCLFSQPRQGQSVGSDVAQ